MKTPTPMAKYDGILTEGVRALLTVSSHGGSHFAAENGAAGFAFSFGTDPDAMVHLLIHHNPDNYPALRVTWSEWPLEQFADFLREQYEGWECISNAHDLPTDEDGTVRETVD